MLTESDDEEENRKRKSRSVKSQIIAAAAKNAILFSGGLSMGFSTIVIASVHNAPQNATLSLTDEEVSWVGSIRFIMNPLGMLASGILSNSIGRRSSMQYLTIPMIAAWLIFRYSNSFVMLFAASAMSGLTSGLLKSPMMTYVSEVTEPYLRGTLSATSSMSMTFGSFLTHFMGGFLHWRTIGGINAAAPALCFLFLFFIPESPYWLLSKNRLKEAEEALCWLRGWTTKEHVKEEYNEILKMTRPQTKTKQQQRKYLKRTFIYPFLLIMFYSFIVRLTGIRTLSLYSINIFNTFGTPINGYYAPTLLNFFRFAGAFASMFLMRRTGRRPLIFTSLTGLGLLFATSGLYGYLYLGLNKMDNGTHVREYFNGAPQHSWLPMMCFLGVPFMSFLGLRSLFRLLIGEVYPMEMRAFASSLHGSLGFVISFVTNKTVFKMIDPLSLPGLFMLYSAVAFASVVVFYFTLPETEGWSLREVQEHFEGKRNLVKAGRKTVVTDMKKKL